MTLYNQKVLFTALAFLAFLLKDGGSAKKDHAAQVNQLAELFEKFCAENIPHPFAGATLNLAEESEATKIDVNIDRHIKELRQKEQTHLPEDRDTLLKLYDRLQLRKSRRMQRYFYASATETNLADAVLRYIDEEIEDAEALS